jgi:hypothetical protein
MKINPNRLDFAICCDSRRGPTFGDDICIKNNAKTTMDSHSNLGFAYSILNMHMEQSKLEHFWLVHINFNWMNSKFFNWNKK